MSADHTETLSAALPRDSQEAGAQSPKVPASAFSVRDGMVFQERTYRAPDECRRLLTVYRRAASAADWWAPLAAGLAADLERAMAEAGISQEQ